MRQMRGAVTDEVFVNEKFRICAAKLCATRPAPFLFVLIAEDHQSFVVVLADEHIDDTLGLPGGNFRAMPDTQALVAGNLGEGEGFVVDVEVEIGLVRVPPAEFVDEQGPEVSGVDEVE